MEVRLQTYIFMGTKLKEKRTEKGYSQKQLSNMTGISTGTIREYEQQRRNIDHAQAKNVALLADALDCSMEELLEQKYLAKKRRRKLILEESKNKEIEELKVDKSQKEQDDIE